MIIRNGSFEVITADHDLNANEMTRILAAGAFIDDLGYICGRLSLARSFGDFDLKNAPGRSQREQAVVALPDVFELDNIGGDDMILLYSDGVFDRSSDSAVYRKLRASLQKHRDDPARLSAI